MRSIFYNLHFIINLDNSVCVGGISLWKNVASMSRIQNKNNTSITLLKNVGCSVYSENPIKLLLHAHLQRVTYIFCKCRGKQWGDKARKSTGMCMSKFIFPKIAKTGYWRKEIAG